MQLTPVFLSGLTGSLDRISSNEQQLTNEISSGYRVNSLSDDPVAAGENVTLSASIQQDDSYHQSTLTATGKLQVTDSALGSVVTQLTQAIAAATEGDSGTNNAGDLAAVATKLSGIRDELLSLANTSYMGSYLFAGSKSNTAPFGLDVSVDPAVVTYNGDSVQSSLTSPQGSSIALNTPGDQIFSAAATNVFGVLNELISDFAAGNVTAAQAATAGLTSAVSFVSQQRAGLDNSITRLTSEDSTLQQQSTQLVTRQTNLLQADTATVATALSSSETQQAALQDVIAALEKQGSLFDVLR
jgi:flagellar hook-associated protein 3 FlgL